MTFYATHSFQDLNRDRLVEDLKNDRVVVVTDIYKKSKCDNLIHQCLDNFEKLGTGFSKQNLEKTWDSDILPDQTAFGLFHNLVGHIDPIWEVRNNSDIESIFNDAYNFVKFNQLPSAKSKKLKLVNSIDGLNLQPNNLGPRQSDMP